jgi:hypothetical protein
VHANHFYVRPTACSAAAITRRAHELANGGCDLRTVEALLAAEGYLAPGEHLNAHPVQERAEVLKGRAPVV